MSAKPSTTEKNGVILSRSGVEEQEFILPDGATLADLLQKAQADTKAVRISINGRPLEDFVILQPGMTVTITELWRDSIGMFADDPYFQEFVDAGRAIREAEREAARNEAEDDEA